MQRQILKAKYESEYGDELLQELKRELRGDLEDCIVAVMDVSRVGMNYSKCGSLLTSSKSLFFANVKHLFYAASNIVRGETTAQSHGRARHRRRDFDRNNLHQKQRQNPSNQNGLRGHVREKSDG